MKVNIKVKDAKKLGCLAGGILALLMIAGLYALSWIVTCGVIKLITLCFGWTFKWSIATGIWLIICIAKSIFGHSKE